MITKKFSIDGIPQDISSEDKITPRGKGAFESFRVHDNRVFMLEEHFERLAKSLKALDINWDKSQQECYSWISKLCDDLPAGQDGFVRFSVIQ